MWAFIITMVLKAKGWIAVGAAAVSMALTVYLSSKRVDKAKTEAAKSKARAEVVETVAIQKVEAAQAASTRQTETAKESANVASQINALEPGSAAERLRNEWTRPD